MRLSERLKNEIQHSLEESFGPIDATLFGSRADDTRRGGDIDVAVSSELSREEFRAGKAAFLASLMRKGFDLPIDLVQFSEASPLLQEEIHRSGVPLCRNLAQQA
uniref:Nucleotidyltransferase domain-containing protein n=1 Tax=Candidatus Kentrum sp. DK TaxID=2126562 RepID=A0A450RUV8_9GAMM|nr:MAG: Nucleotidyltransferase domain-containing protein [Candidatus Kentron sp. DK]